jgi:N-acetyl-gamma-glutamyl-phosphate/LysW-gamma-L-alpha-aminoadipyl-6-phosphate reductase
VARVSIVGGSGYVGGELLRLLVTHPHVQLCQVTSEQHCGRFVHGLHPNLRSRTRQKFCGIGDLEPCDILFLALPHGEAAGQVERFARLADRIIDTSADFRLHDPDTYRHWYGADHPRPDWLDRFAYGLPEFHRQRLRQVRYASGVGCNATAVNLALAPLARTGRIELVVADLKVGSSEGGHHVHAGSHHPERSGAVRSFAPAGHRHEAEIRQELGAIALHFSATAVELVRGVLCTAHVFLPEPLEEKQVWNLYREAYADEPFIRLVRDRKGLYRYPEPKILAGTNYCDIGFAMDNNQRRIVVISALDNLMKGAAGNAVQVMNVMMNWDETAGLQFPGLHPT